MEVCTRHREEIERRRNGRGRDVIARDLHLVKGAREGTRLYSVGQTRDMWIGGLDRQRAARGTGERLFRVRLLWRTPGWTIKPGIVREACNGRGRLGARRCVA